MFSENKENKVFLCLLSALQVVLNSLWHGLAITLMWNVFLSPVCGIKIPFSTAVGAIIILGILRSRDSIELLRKKEEEAPLPEVTLSFSMNNFVYLSLGLILFLFF